MKIKDRQNHPFICAVFILTLFSTLDINAQGCAFPQMNEFKKVKVTGNVPGVHMSVLDDGTIFVLDMDGRVSRYSPPANVIELGRVPTNGGRGVEEGALGIVADINFSKNHWLYIIHTPAELGTCELTRYTVTNDKIANPKMILNFSRNRDPHAGQNFGNDQRHAGGGMAWNKKTGDLFISIGDDTNPFGDNSIYGPRDPDDSLTSALHTAANTNDLRGKSIRIRPIPFGENETPLPALGSTYTVPAGNLFPPGTPKTRAEIYSMGHRNAYRIKVDSVTGWVMVGEVGADADSYDAKKGPPGYDKVTLFKGPGNAGWPFTNGNLEPYIVRGDLDKEYVAAGLKVGDKFDLNHLKNLSKFNSGLVDLPGSIVPPLVYYCNGGYQKGIDSVLGGGAETVMAGPVYNFDPNLVSNYKMPPSVHRSMFFGDWSRERIWAATLDADGKASAIHEVADGKVIDMDMGPDGTLYYLDYNDRAVYSIQYQGMQKDYHACSFIKEGCTDSRYLEYDKMANLNMPGKCINAAVNSIKYGNPSKPHLLSNMKSGIVAIPAGATGVVIFNLTGKKIFSADGIGPVELSLPKDVKNLDLVYVKYVTK